MLCVKMFELENAEMKNTEMREKLNLNTRLRKIEEGERRQEKVAVDPEVFSMKNGKSREEIFEYIGFFKRLEIKWI